MSDTTYVVLRGESGQGYGTVLYAGMDEELAELRAKRECGEGEIRPDGETIPCRYHTKVEVWKDDEKVDEWGYTKNGHKVVDAQVIRDESTDVSADRGTV